MRVISRKKLADYWTLRPETEEALKAWYAEARKATWSDPADIKEQYRSASILKKGYVVFNICGNKHRLVVRINYAYACVYVRFLGTHREYDGKDVETL